MTAPAPATTASSEVTRTTAVSTTVPGEPVPFDAGELTGFSFIEATLGAERLTLAVADEPALRSRGLMGVTDLGSVDGMLFTWGGEQVTSRFFMLNTLMPLTIAFFGDQGDLVDVVDMVPCEEDPCPTYGASGPYAYAVEFPAGRRVAADDVLVFDSPG
jgi:uncharacterized membrane protein (UPF0127 family)